MIATRTAKGGIGLGLFGALILLGLAGWGVGPARGAETPGLYAEIHTNKGVILARLFYKRAPLTVLNFLRLAEGTGQWIDPKSGKPVSGRPLYRNLLFHHVRDFMVQTGDPTGTGRGGPGYVFDDEIHPELTHGKAGVLSMANRGPDTNGSQFFITTRPAPWLDGRYTIFGQVVTGLDVLRRIRKGDRLQNIVIIRRGAEAQAFTGKVAHQLAQQNLAAFRKRAEKSVPEPTAPLDPAKVPKPNQPLVSPGNFSFLVIGHTEIPQLARLNRVFAYDRKQALAVARKIVRLARARGADFLALVKAYTDMPYNTAAKNVRLSPTDPAALAAIFRLKPGQISDPIDLPSGVYVFQRLPDH